MKAMSQTLYLVVAAIVILVTAVIILAVFFQGLAPVMGLTEAKSICITSATTSCSSFGQMPPTWNVKNIKVNREGSSVTESCSGIVGTCTCDANSKMLTGACVSSSSATNDKCLEPGAAERYIDCR